WRTSDLSMGRCVCSLDDVHGPLEHEWPASSSLQEPCALILGQPPRTAANQSAGGTGRCSLPFWTLMPISKPLIAETYTTGAVSIRCKAVSDKAPPPWASHKRAQVSRLTGATPASRPAWVVRADRSCGGSAA